MLLKHLIKLVNGFPFTPASPEGISAHAQLSIVLILEMTGWASIVKHKAFSEEEEWRIITYPRSATLVAMAPKAYEGVSVRPTSRLLLQYMALQALSGKWLPIIEINANRVSTTIRKSNEYSIAQT